MRPTSKRYVRTHLALNILLTGTLALLALCTVTIAEARVERQVDFPVLLVSTNPDGTETGTLEVLTLEVNELKRPGPLQVAVVEETPSGAGDMLRASLWLAATTAALELGTPLDGYRVQVTTHGRMDGPSAGAMMTLALLSAFTGRDLPNDFAFTGTILPDGSVGKVGGILHKIKAAARAGKKRILLPRSIRLELHDSWVDLKKVCSDLKVQYIPVSNLRDVMREIHRTPSAPMGAPLPAIPSELDDFLTHRMRAALSSQHDFESSLSEQEMRRVNSKFSEDMLDDSRKKMITAWAQGSIPQAYTSIDFLLKRLSKRMAWASIELKKVTQEDTVAFRQFMETSAQKLKSGVGAFELVGEPPSSASPVLAELDRFPHEVAKLNSGVSSHIKTLVEAKSGSYVSEAKQEEAVFELFALKHLYTVVQEKQKSFQALSPLYPGKRSTPESRHFAIEGLLYSAFLAVDSTLTTNIVQPIGEEKGVSLEKAAEQLAATDAGYRTHREEQHISEILHERVKDSSSLYSLAQIAHAHAEALANASAQLIRFELEPEQLNDNRGKAGVTVYRNAYLLRSLLDSAREEAVVAIDRCQQEKLGCWASVLMVHSADAERDQYDKDKLSVFTQYMTAALKAKLTRLLFS